MNKTELESKHLAELHELAAEAGVERYRMLPRAELIEKLAGANGKPQAPAEQPPAAEPPPPAEKAPAAEQAAPAAAERPKRKRRRRRWGRRRKGMRLQDVLLPATSGRQAIVYAESRAACTALLRELASELADASDGPDPIALLVDPPPEELAEWRREAPRAELVAAGQARHADDAIAQASSRANAGENVIVLVDSLSRFAEEFAGPDEARDLLDAGLRATRGGSGTLTIVAALEKS